MVCLHSISSREEWVLILYGSQHLHENRENLREFLDYSFLLTMFLVQKVYHE